MIVDSQSGMLARRFWLVPLLIVSLLLPWCVMACEQVSATLPEHRAVQDSVLPCHAKVLAESADTVDSARYDHSYGHSYEHATCIGCALDAWVVLLELHEKTSWISIYYWSNPLLSPVIDRVVHLAQPPPLLLHTTLFWQGVLLLI
ncbi:MAG: hypothetical protein IBX52_09940 [Bacterioplanes sp.]|nr:hypothetical protein [Bacterioplanes sp.]